MKDCVIIGGGIVGLCSAYYLAKSGHQVSVVDKGDFSDGCSYGNAGMIVPSHVIPLAQPGMIAKGIKWMFSNKSPFYVRPRLSSELISWGLKFYRHSSLQHVNSSKQALLDLSLLSKDLYRDLSAQSNLFYEEKGLLMLYLTDKMGEEETHVAKIAEELGVEVAYYNKSELGQINYGVNTAAIGGVHYKSDAHLSPNLLMQFLKSELKSMNVRLIENSELQGFKIASGRIEAYITKNGVVRADEFIVAAGSWTPTILRKLGIRINLLPGKGYSFDEEKSEYSPSIPTILCEGKVAVSPMGNQIRFGGTLEVTHLRDRSIKMSRVEGIVKTINQFYPDKAMKVPSTEKIWSGFRPCTATGLPIISRSEKYSNLIVAAGHGMMGLSLGPASGKIVEELVKGSKSSVSIDSFKLI